jgi:hypothetical protein
MLLDIKCSTVLSFKIDLKYDDNRADKSVVISVGDLVDVDFNYNGCRKLVQGRIIKLYAEGTDPKKWYIILDSADLYSSDTYKFSPANILDITVISKADATQYIASTNDYTNIKALRIVQGTLQYTQDGATWLPIYIDPQFIIEDENYGIGPGGPRPPRPRPCNCGNTSDTIIDEG